MEVHVGEGEEFRPLAEQLGVDTVVISSHGRSGVTRAVWGSITEAVLRGSHRPVFVVR